MDFLVADFAHPCAFATNGIDRPSQERRLHVGADRADKQRCISESGRYLGLVSSYLFTFRHALLLSSSISHHSQ
jgi:hypothetical protein